MFVKIKSFEELCNLPVFTLHTDGELYYYGKCGDPDYLCDKRDCGRTLKVTRTTCYDRLTDEHSSSPIGYICVFNEYTDTFVLNEEVDLIMESSDEG